MITDSATGIAIDPGDDHIYVDKRNSVSEYDAAGAFVVEFGSGRVVNSVGVAVDGGKLFVSNSIPPVQVNVFGPLATIPDVSAGPAPAVTTTSATVSGTLNPVGIAATYQFEWGTDTDYGNVAPAVPVDAGNGTDNMPATANLSGLTPGTTYHYRLKGTNAGGSNFSQDSTFTTLSPPTIVSTSGEGGARSATLTALVNPRGPDTSFHFEYGSTTAMGRVRPKQCSAAASTTSQPRRPSPASSPAGPTTPASPRRTPAALRHVRTRPWSPLHPHRSAACR